MSYPPVTICNSTPFNVNGTVEYASCPNDSYHMTPYTCWSTHLRSDCLITKITGTAHTPDGDFQATPYTSSGTSYGQFAIIQTGPHTFVITRIVDGSEDQRPEGYVEPTTQQK